MLMYLMDGRELLNLLLQTLIFRGLLRFLFLSLYYAYLELKSIHYSTSFCRKKDIQFNRKKGRKEGCEGRNGINFCIIDLWHILFIE